MDKYNKILVLTTFTAMRTHCLQRSHHVLHADADLSITVKCSIEAHYVGRITLM